MEDAAFREWIRIVVDRFELTPAAAAAMLRRIQMELKTAKQKVLPDTADRNIPSESMKEGSADAWIYPQAD